MAEEKIQSTLANSHRSATDSKDSDISVRNFTFNSARSVNPQLIVSGTSEIVANGIAMTAVILIWTSLLNTIRNDTSGNFVHDINKYSLLLLYFPIGVWFAALLEAFWRARTAERQASRVRRKYLKAILMDASTPRAPPHHKVVTMVHLIDPTMSSLGLCGSGVVVCKEVVKDGFGSPPTY